MIYRVGSKLHRIFVKIKAGHAPTSASPGPVGGLRDLSHPNAEWVVVGSPSVSPLECVNCSGPVFPSECQHCRPPQCGFCRVVLRPKQRAGRCPCDTEWYCSVWCQAAHWNHHRAYCVLVREERRAARTPGREEAAQLFRLAARVAHRHGIAGANEVRTPDPTGTPNGP